MQPATINPTHLPPLPPRDTGAALPESVQQPPRSLFFAPALAPVLAPHCLQAAGQAGPSYGKPMPPAASLACLANARGFRRVLKFRPSPLTAAAWQFLTMTRLAASYAFRDPASPAASLCRQSVIAAASAAPSHGSDRTCRFPPVTARRADLLHRRQARRAVSFSPLPLFQCGHGRR